VHLLDVKIDREMNDAVPIDVPPSSTDAMAIALAPSAGPDTGPVPRLIINLYDNCRKG
jgi:hypothetical protein